jgi:hypothetical protein
MPKKQPRGAAFLVLIFWCRSGDALGGSVLHFLQYETDRYRNQPMQGLRRLNSDSTNQTLIKVVLGLGLHLGLTLEIRRIVEESGDLLFEPMNMVRLQAVALAESGQIAVDVESKFVGATSSIPEIDNRVRELLVVANRASILEEHWRPYKRFTSQMGIAAQSTHLFYSSSGDDSAEDPDFLRKFTHGGSLNTLCSG